MMGDIELHRYCWQNVRSLDPKKVEAAVEMLKQELPPETLADLKQRVEEDPIGWLGGKKDIECPHCKGAGVERRLKKEVREDLEKWQRKRPKPFLIDHEYFERQKTLEADENNLAPEETCFWCHGKKRTEEGPLHHGFGTGVRNLLRQKGFGEKEFGIDNLDDYYSPILEMVAGKTGPSA